MVYFKQMIGLDLPTIALLIGLFIILSPGILLTLPPLDQTTIIELGVGYMNGSPGTAAYCSALTTAEPECDKPTETWVSGYTSNGAAIIHAVVFVLLLLFVPALLSFLGVEMRTLPFTFIIVLGLLFFILSPGVLLTIPALSAADCGQDGKNIIDDGDSSPANPKFCAGSYDSWPAGTVFTAVDWPHCNKCTSWFNSGQTNFLPVVVHSAVFAGLAWFSARYVFSDNPKMLDRP